MQVDIQFGPAFALGTVTLGPGDRSRPRPAPWPA